MNFEDQNPRNDFVRPPNQRRVNRWTKRNIIQAALTAIGVFFVGIYVLAQIDSKLSLVVRNRMLHFIWRRKRRDAHHAKGRRASSRHAGIRRLEPAAHSRV